MSTDCSHGMSSTIWCRECRSVIEDHTAPIEHDTSFSIASALAINELNFVSNVDSIETINLGDAAARTVPGFKTIMFEMRLSLRKGVTTDFLFKDLRTEFNKNGIIVDNLEQFPLDSLDSDDWSVQLAGQITSTSEFIEYIRKFQVSEGLEKMLQEIQNT